MLPSSSKARATMCRHLPIRDIICAGAMRVAALDTAHRQYIGLQLPAPASAAHCPTYKVATGAELAGCVQQGTLS